MNEQNKDSNTIPTVDPNALNQEVKNIVANQANQTQPVINTNSTTNAVPASQNATVQSVNPAPLANKEPQKENFGQELSGADIIIPGQESAPTANVVNGEQVIDPQSIMPSQSDVIDTEKKTSSNVILVILLIIMALIAFFMQDIINLFNKTIAPFTTSTTEVTSGDLIDGYMKIEENGFMIVEKVKFYNYKKSTEPNLIINYLPQKNLSSASDYQIYIEIYNSDKVLIYKELFNPSADLEKDTVKQYTMKVTSSVYKSAFYVKVKTYTDDEKKSTSTLTCTYTATGSDELKVIYKTIYNFQNNDLISYDIDKSYTTTNAESTEALKYKEEIKKEYLKITDYNIKSTYTDTSLKYTIDLSKLPDGFTPSYIKGTVSKTINDKETLKKWVCK